MPGLMAWLSFNKICGGCCNNVEQRWTEIIGLTKSLHSLVRERLVVEKVGVPSWNTGRAGTRVVSKMVRILGLTEHPPSVPNYFATRVGG